MNDLPDVVLVSVFSHLRVRDRLTAALTCRRWAETIVTTRFMEDIQLCIPGPELIAAARVLSKTKRKYRSLRIDNADPSQHGRDVYQLYSVLGASLRELEFIDCPWPWFKDTFYRILAQCSKLESLTIGYYKFYDGDPSNSARFRPPEFAMSHFRCSKCEWIWKRKCVACFPLETIRGSLGHIRNLRMDVCVSAKAFDFLLEIMPNVRSLSLTSASLSDRLFWDLPSHLEPHREITRLDLAPGRIPPGPFAAIMGACSKSLLEFQTHNLRLTDESYAAIGACTKLRSLELRGMYGTLEDDQLKMILVGLRNLKTLAVLPPLDLRDENLSIILEQEGLERLELCARASFPHTFMRCLGKRKTLRHLKLEQQGQRIDGQLMRTFLSLSNLRTLSLYSENLAPECLDLICASFENLEDLCLGKISEFTDADGRKFAKLRNLRSLSLNSAAGLTDLTFQGRIGFAAMVKLRIHGSPLTDAALASIAVNHRRLKRLDLGACSKITDDGLVSLLEREPYLEHLDLRSLDSVSGRWTDAMDKLCPRLRFMNTDSSAVKLWFLERRSSVKSISDYSNRVNKRFRSIRGQGDLGVLAASVQRNLDRSRSFKRIRWIRGL